MNDPKPHVVGMAWVVACAEAQARVDEAEYLIDLTEVNVAGTNKAVRPSYFPANRCSPAFPATQINDS